MTSNPLSGSRRSLEAAQEVTERFGGAFARAFAVFTAELVAQLETKHDAPTAGKNAGSETSIGEEGAPVDPLTDAPQWIRDACQRVMRGASGTGLSFEAANAIVLRNRLVSEMRNGHITPADLARRLRTTPASVSRMIREPRPGDLSALETLLDEKRYDLHL
jgi:hypothetical protein